MRTKVTSAFSRCGLGDNNPRKLLEGLVAASGNVPEGFSDPGVHISQKPVRARIRKHQEKVVEACLSPSKDFSIINPNVPHGLKVSFTS